MSTWGPRERAVVVIPTYDEAESIGPIVDQVLAQPTPVPVDVLVVDDNSPDGTAGKVLEHPEYGRRVFLLNRPGKQGLGAAYRAGFGWALSRQYTVVVQMDADGSHPAASLPALLERMVDHDLAIGSRYVPGGSTVDWAWSRRALSRGANTYVRVMLRLPVRDATAGFRAWRSTAVVAAQVLESAANGYAFQIENTWRSVRAGLRLTEVPITFVERAQGSSKMSSAVAVEALLRVLRWFAADLVRLSLRASSRRSRRSAGSLRPPPTLPAQRRSSTAGRRSTPSR